MKPLFCLLLLILVLEAIYGQRAVEQTDNSKKHPGYCYSTTKGVGAMELGEVKKQEGECVRISCLEGGVITYDGCGSVGVPLNCKILEGDSSKAYPDCCPGIKC